MLTSCVSKFYQSPGMNSKEMRCTTTDWLDDRKVGRSMQCTSALVQGRKNYIGGGYTKRMQTALVTSTCYSCQKDQYTSNEEAHTSSVSA